LFFLNLQEEHSACLDYTKGRSYIEAQASSFFGPLRKVACQCQSRFRDSVFICKV